MEYMQALVLILALGWAKGVNAGIEPVIIKVAGDYYFTNEVSSLPGSGWVTNYAVPTGRVLVIEFIGQRDWDSDSDNLAVQVDDGIFYFRLPFSESDWKGFTSVGGLKLASGWQLPGRVWVEAWDEGLTPIDRRYVLFGYLTDGVGSSGSAVGIQSRIESPMLEGGVLRMTVATPRPATHISIEKSRDLADDWVPVTDAAVEPTADPNRQTATVPATDPRAFLRATASSNPPE